LVQHPTISKLIVALPVGNPSYHPQSEINTQFGGIVPENGVSMLVHSNFTVQVSIPTVNLDNFEVIPQVHCTSTSSLQMTFHDLTTLKHAQIAWNPHAPFAVMFTYAQSESCQQFGPRDEPPTPDEVPRLLFQATQVTFDPAKLTGTLQGKFVSVMDTLGQYSMQVQQKIVPQAPGDLAKDPTSFRRRLARWIKDLWMRDHAYYKEGHFSFNGNYDPERQAAKRPWNVVDRLALPVGELMPNLGTTAEWLRLLRQTTLQCTNCYAHGKINFKLKMTGNFLQRTYQYALTMQGHLELNMDWKLVLHRGGRVELPRIPILGDLLNLAELSGIPGLLTLKPELGVELMLAYKVIQPASGVGFTMGAHVRFPLNLHLEGSSVAGPTHKWDMTPQFTAHPLQRIPSEDPAQVELTVGLVPRLGFRLATLSKVNLLDLALELENNLELHLQEKDPHCTERSKTKTLGLQIMRQHRLVMTLDTIVSSHEFPIVGERFPIPKCSFCNTCLDPNVLNQAKTHLGR
jgi:hypothetical protein